MTNTLFKSLASFGQNTKRIAFGKYSTPSLIYFLGVSILDLVLNWRRKPVLFWLLGETDQRINLSLCTLRHPNEQKNTRQEGWFAAIMPTRQIRQTRCESRALNPTLRARSAQLAIKYAQRNDRSAGRRSETAQLLANVSGEWK
ncbi:hypothetical protein M4951_20430 [Blastopirellula sp. J2-11]|uniref:hypothetical protein n=1 Tax=Blastopirellula sp. J2-11 TaxID=2943192 RepID=UPI0021CA69DD|nr:hypothetical protein [Blastopirellula sp. J2-11]UUO05729.1 hypothetical protein M4951_20430 [Blastopirellula sp. J2-11]